MLHYFKNMVIIETINKTQRQGRVYNIHFLRERNGGGIFVK